MIAIRKITDKLVAYTKNMHDLVSPKMTKNMSWIDNVSAETHRQSKVPGSVPSL